MENGTNIEDIERRLNLVFEAFYVGLNKVADKVRTGESPDTIANEIQTLAVDFCKHWPTCLAAYISDPEQQSQQRPA